MSEMEIPPANPRPQAVSPGAVAFGSAIRALTPRGFVTEILVGVNVLVFVVMVIRGVSPLEPKVPELLAWGAGYGPRTTGGEGWRLFTATFLHIGALHLGMNMYALWSVARLVERIFGNAGFLVLYLAAGLSGSVASVLWHPYVVSAGASGAVFGVFGGLLGFLVRERRSLPREVLQSLQKSTVVFIGLNLMIGLSVKGIDMAAHVGGLVGGFLGGLALAHPLTIEGASRRGLRAALLAAATVAATAVALRVLPRHEYDFWAELSRFDEVEKRSLATFSHALAEAKADRMTDEQLADEIDTKILPDWHTSLVRMSAGKDLPASEAKLVDKLVAYMSAREEAFRLLSEAGRTHDKTLVQRSNAKQDEAARLIKEIGNKE